MEKSSIISTSAHIPENAVQAISISQFLFSSTNGLSLAAIILLVISKYSSDRVDLSSLWLTIPLAICIIVTACASFYRVFRSNELGATLADWRNVSRRKYKVLRRGNSEEITLRASQLTPGDVVLLEVKQIVPADMQIVSGTIKVDEGGYISEKVPVVRKAGSSMSQQSSETFLFKGAKVVEGSARGLVIYCGDETALSRKYDTTLQADLKYFYKRVLALTAIVSVIFGVIGQWVVTQTDTQYSLGDKEALVLYLIAGIVVSSVPSLLTVSLVSCLAKAERFIRKKYFFYLSKLDLITSLASMSVLAIGSRKYIVGDDFSGISEGDLVCCENQDPKELHLAIAATLASYDNSVKDWLERQEGGFAYDFGDSKIDIDPVFHVIKRRCGNVEYMCCAPAAGNADIAIEKRDLSDPSAEWKLLGTIKWKNLDTINSNTKKGLSLLKLMGLSLVPVFESTTVMDSKKATERVLVSAGLMQVKDSDVQPDEAGEESNPPSPALMQTIESAGEEDSESVYSGNEECLVDDQVLEFIKSGIHVSTNAEDSHAIKSLVGRRQLGLLSSQNLRNLIHSNQVGFYNVNLLQKLRIVASLKHVKHGCTVGFLGGSSPGDRMALLAAHIGISSQIFLGRSSDAVIARPEEYSFESIGKSILEARTSVCNLRRSAMYLMSQIVPRLMPLLMTLAFALPIGLSLTLILVGCLLIDLPVALAFMWEHPEYDLPFRKPRNEIHEKIISQKMILLSIVFLGPLGGLSGFLAYCQSFSDFGFDPNGLAGLGTANIVDFAPVQNNTKEPGFPSTSGYPLDLSLHVLDGLHLCGRVGNVISLTPAALAAVPVEHRCDGPLFTLDKFNQFCYTTNSKNGNSAGYTAAMQDIVSLFVQQKGVAGVVFQRNTTAGYEGLPICGFKNGDGIYVPWGFYTSQNQAIVDKALSGYTCIFNTPVMNNNTLSGCFTSEAIAYAQTAFFASITIFAIFSALLILRTELFSFFHIGIVNHNWAVLIGCMLSVGLVLVVIFVQPVKDILNTRQISISNLFAPAIPFIILAFILEELRKFHIRRKTRVGHWLMQKTMW
jgi:magnesium-transporting ATPase (P-type)